MGQSCSDSWATPDGSDESGLLLPCSAHMEDALTKPLLCDGQMTVSLCPFLVHSVTSQASSSSLQAEAQFSPTLQESS